MEVKQNKWNGLKYFLFIGLPVFILLGCLGFYFYLTNPTRLMKLTIESSVEELEKLSKNNQYAIDLSKEPFVASGNIKIKTDIADYKALEDYNYSYELEVNNPKKILNLGFGINKDTNEILKINVIKKKETNYVSIPKLFDKLIQFEDNLLTTGNCEEENCIPEENKEFPNVYANNEDLIYFTKKFKDIFLSHIESQKLEKDKKDLSINQEQLKTTRIRLLVDIEMQKEILQSLTKEIRNNKRLLSYLSKTTNIEEDELKGILTEEIKFDEDATDYYFEIYVKGIQDVVKVSIISKENKNEFISATSYKDTNLIELKNNDFEINFNLLNENKMSFNIVVLSTNDIINGTVENINENEGKISLTFKNEEMTIDLDITAKITKESITNIDNIESVPYEELTTEQYAEILENLEKVIEDTYFYDLLEKNVM